MLNKNFGNKYDLVFYRIATHSHFDNLAEACGVNDNCDIACALPYIGEHDTVLDIGGGYGRIVSFLQDKRPNCHLHAIEVIPNLCKILRSNYPDATIWEGDILKTEYTNTLPKFDVITIMWGTFLSFSPAEHIKLLITLKNKLKDNGFIIIDIPHPKSPTSQNHYNKAHTIIKSCSGVDLNFTSLTPEDWEKYTKHANLQIKQTAPYLAANNGIRNIYILTHYG